MANSFSILPLNYDPLYIIEKAGVTNHFGYEAKEDGIHFRYLVDDFDAVQAAIAAYPVDHLEVERPKALSDLSFIRETRSQHFTYNGITVPLDERTKANLIGAAVGLERNPEVLSIEWSLGGGQFVTLPREVVSGMADAAFIYIQGCFAHQKTLADQIKSAADINALAAIDLQAGWPS